MNRRVHIKEFLLVAACLAGVYVLYSLHSASQCPVQPPHVLTTSEAHPSKGLEGDIVPLSCSLNREVSKNVGIAANKNLQCYLKDHSQVLVPFSFFKNYYELIGSFHQGQDGQEFEISSSSSRVIPPSEPYSSDGQFMHFASFDVQGRSRVVCVSAAEGVPLSNQWDPRGYFYPTQIAQFALSHYSSWVKAGRQSGERHTIELDKLSNSGSLVEDNDHQVFQFDGSVKVDLSSLFPILSLDLKLLDDATQSGLEVVVELPGADKHRVRLSYTRSTRHIHVAAAGVGDRRTFVFGFGAKADGGSWLRLTRDLTNDLKKGLQAANDKARLKSLKRTPVRVVSLALVGKGRVANVSLSQTEHMRMFSAGADWFVKNQDERGGWPSHVVFNPKRKKYPQAEEIPPGWYGAMCQGQAISVLCRAYHATKDEKYLRAARAAIKPFSIDSKDGGVRASFLGVHTWYEEYPTSPSTFILNGFMYSLLGLYDLSKTDPSDFEAKKLFQTGIKSLEALLPLYDAASGTYYDLRHFSMKTSPKMARWDYHTTHINQLLLLASIHANSSKQFLETAERWRGYMVGKRAPHN